MRGLLFATALLAGAAYVVPAHALVFELTENGCAGGCGATATVFGTIDVEQTAVGSVTVTETLYDGFQFEKSSAGRALQFNLSGDPAITITKLTKGFAVVSDPTPNAPPFGAFDYLIACSKCGAGGSNPLVSGPLTFTITGAMISPASFVANKKGYYFSSNIGNLDGFHGNVAANYATVPEPASIALLGAGLIGFGMVRRRTA